MLAQKKAVKKRETAGKYLIRSCFRQVIAIQAKPVSVQTLPATTGIPVLDMAYRM
jgi:hypothetical protein